MTRDVIHGGALDVMRATFPDAPTPWIDLSTGLNPWPYPDTDISVGALKHLPVRAMYDSCCEAMAAAINAPRDALLLSPGSEILIRLLPDIIRPQRVAILSPTYGDHETVWRRAGSDIVQTADPLSLSLSVDAVVLTHPNNPDGRLFDPGAIEIARRDLASRGGWLIVDEAYADLAPSLSMAPRGGADGLIVLRSFGKFFGLGGIRLGGILAPEHVRIALAERLGHWPVSGTALEIGTRAYADANWQKQTRINLAKAASRLDEILVAGGLRVVGGSSLFRYVTVADAPLTFKQLAKAGIYVRRFDWSETHLRIGLPGTSDEEGRLGAALSLLA